MRTSTFSSRCLESSLKLPRVSFLFFSWVFCSKTNRHWLLMLFLAFGCLKMLKDLCRYAMSSLPAFSTAKDVNLLPRWWKGCFPKRWPRPQPSQRLREICETLQNHGINMFKLNVIHYRILYLPNWCVRVREKPEIKGYFYTLSLENLVTFWIFKDFYLIWWFSRGGCEGLGSKMLIH